MRCASICLLILCALVCGCASRGSVNTSDCALFAPVAMRIHPIFSGLKDWSGDGKPDGIEALLEFEDQFGDPTKAAGTVIFELFTFADYRDNYKPDPRGERICNPWVGSLRTLADQEARWNRTSRTYLFQLDEPSVRDDKSYVLTATFDTGTTRFFDQIVLEGHPHPKGPSSKPTSRPSTQATTAPTTQPTTIPITTPAGNVTTRP
jgi:hypothetical protein